MTFDVSTIPSDAAIKGATLSLFQTLAGQTTIGAHQITASWTETGVTWNTRDGVTGWTTAGGDFVTAATGTALSSSQVNVWVNLGDRRGCPGMG